MARRRMSLWGAAALITAMVGGLAWSFAPDPGSTAATKLLPANAVLYVGIDGGESHMEAFKKTAAYDALYESGLMDTVKKAIDRLKEQAGAAGVDQGLSTTVLRLVKHIMDHGLSLAVAIEPNNAGPPVAYAVVVLHDGAEFKDAIAAALQGARRRTSCLHDVARDDRRPPPQVVLLTPARP